MSLHNFMDKLSNAQLNDTGQTLYAPTYGYLLGWGVTVGNGLQSWSKGALFLDLDAATGAQFWVNVGTSAAASWKAITSLDAANTWAALQTFAAGLTVSASQTLAVTTADYLTVGGIIVPQHLEFSYPIPTIAGVVIYDCFIAPRAYTVTNIRYVPSVVQGGAMTITPVKVADGATPAAATTPLVSSAFNANTGAYTQQTGALTATGADLILAAGNRISAVLSTASTVHQGTLTFSLKRS